MAARRRASPRGPDKRRAVRPRPTTGSRGQRDRHPSSRRGRDRGGRRTDRVRFVWWGRVQRDESASNRADHPRAAIPLCRAQARSGGPRSTRASPTGSSARPTSTARVRPACSRARWLQHSSNRERKVGRSAFTAMAIRHATSSTSAMSSRRCSLSAVPPPTVEPGMWRLGGASRSPSSPTRSSRPSADRSADRSDLAGRGTSPARRSPPPRCGASAGRRASLSATGSPTSPSRPGEAASRAPRRPLRSPERRARQGQV